MSENSLIDNDTFITTILAVGVISIIAILLSKDYELVSNFTIYTLLFVILEVLGIIAAICILTYLILKIFHLTQYLLVRRKIIDSNQKEQTIKQNKKENITKLCQELDKIFLEAKPLLNSENTPENLQKLEKIQTKILQSKFKELSLHNQRIKYIQQIGEKIKKIETYLKSVEKAIFDRKESIAKSLNIEKGYFKRSNLSEEQIKILREKGFKEFSCREINGIGNTIYLLKPRHNESAEHFFLVMQIHEYIKDKTKNIVLHNSVEPDVIFEYANQKFAVEVETGNMLASKKEELLNKVAENNKKFGNNWFFVVTSKKLVSKYKKFHHQTYNRKKIEEVLKNLFDPSKNPCENQQKSQVQFINKFTREIPQNFQSNSLNSQK